MKTPETLLLGIETSCDETGAALLGERRGLLSNVVASSEAFHARYGGIVPEIASRKQVELMGPVISQAMEQAGVAFSDLDGVAVTAGPGLVGSLLVGMCAAKAIAFAHGAALLGVNHLEAHIFANWIESRALAGGEAVEPRPPCLVLIVSGGHSDLVLIEGRLRYRMLGRTRDDAAGEAFDKGARLLGLPYPGGPALDALAREGDAGAVAFPRAQLPGSWDFSFSGVKTALARYLERGEAAARADIAAAYQEAIVEMLVEKTLAAAAEFDAAQVLLAGGVACNSRLRAMFAGRGREAGVTVAAPPPHLCTDNAAMIACAGMARFRAGERSPMHVDVAASLPLPGARA